MYTELNLNFSICRIYFQSQTQVNQWDLFLNGFSLILKSDLLSCFVQLKEQVMLLEAQLEKQLESISFSQTYAEEVAQVG